MPRPQLSADEWRVRTQSARRNARFTYAERRIRALVETEPTFTDDQLADLADLIRSSGGAA